jgi:SAM-dependent methyltransferase
MIDNIQKIADAQDFHDPRLEHIARSCLNIEPHLSPRAWEYEMAYLALERADMLKAEHRGICFGSGREPVIFGVANRTTHLTVTDLYSAVTDWVVAKTDDPKGYVMHAGPPGFDGQKIDVRTMDMCKIEYPDACFDFAYSISAFEHIGHDEAFLRHLSEVRRVLKPNGVYVLTTEVGLQQDSVPIKGNYVFSLSHLFRLFRESGLNPERTFDARLSERVENECRALSETKSHDAANTELLIVREVGGVMSVPGVFILRSESCEDVTVVGLDETIKFLVDKETAKRQIRYGDWFTVNPYGLTQGSSSPYCDMWSDGTTQAETQLVFSSSYWYFGSDEMEFRVTIVTSPDRRTSGSMLVAVQSWSLSNVDDMVAVHPQKVDLAGSGIAKHLRFKIRCENGRRYAVFGLHRSGRILLSDVTVAMRRALVV